MAKVSLDGKFYTVKDGTIHRRNINPRAARFDTGTPGYSSFTEGSAKAYKGLRGGIGHKYDDGQEECYFTNGLDATHRGGIVPGPKINTAGTFGVAPVKIIDFEGSTYAIGASKISKWNTSTSKWDSKETGIAAPLDAIVVTDSTDSYLIVTDATSAKYTTDGTTWSALTGPMGYMTIFDNKLYGFYANTLYNSPAKASDGTWDIDGTWGSCKYMHYFGTVYGLFTAKSQVNDEPLLCLHSSEALWTIEPWVQQAYPYLPLTGHTYCGMAGMFFNSYIWVSTLGGIKKIAGSLITDVGPDQDDGLPTGYQGYVYDMCVAGDGSWMVFSVHNKGSSDKSSICKRHGTVGGNQQIYSTAAADTAITCVHYSPSHLYANGRLWWGEGTNVKYCMMPDFNTDVTQIADYECVLSSGKGVLPIFTAGMEAFAKTAIRVRGATKGCDSNLKYTVYYRTDADCFDTIDSDTWTELGTFTASPSPTALDFESGAGLAFKQLQLAVASTTNSATSLPVLLSLELDYDAPTKVISSWTLPIAVGRHNSKKIVSDLYTSRDKETLLAFYPSGDSNHGTCHWVKIDNIAGNVEWAMHRLTGTIQVAVKELIRG